MTTTAGRAYQSMLRTKITPALTAMGLVSANGGVFTLPDEDAYIQIGFQKSRNSDAVDMTFTVNVSAISKRDWAYYAKVARYPVAPETPHVHADYPVGLTERIGHFMDTPRDYWWKIKAGDDTTAVAQDVIDLIRNRALPAMTAAVSRTPAAG